ncbi:hypothetical protein DL96DRAFT_1557693 [Flagelloscypha sp. PMI_526]|nr:hypothetical protein DL96DRAFT_1557693 [Flagelloscypha sp. PMI_526]
MSLGPSLVNLARGVPNVGSVPSLLKREEVLLERDEPLAAVTGKSSGAGSTTIDPAILEAIDRWTGKPAGLWSPNRFYDNWGKREIESDPVVVDERDVKPPIWKPAGAFRFGSWLNSWHKREIESDPVVVDERDVKPPIWKPAGAFRIGSWLNSWHKREAAPPGKAGGMFGVNRYISAFNREFLDDMKRSTVAELD